MERFWEQRVCTGCGAHTGSAKPAPLGQPARADTARSRAALPGKIQAKQMHTKPPLEKNKSFRSLVSAMQLSLLLIYPRSELCCVIFYMLMLDLSNILSVCQHEVHNDPCLAGSRFGCIHVWLDGFLWALPPVLCAVHAGTADAWFGLPCCGLCPGPGVCSRGCRGPGSRSSPGLGPNAGTRLHVQVKINLDKIRICNRCSNSVGGCFL